MRSTLLRTIAVLLAACALRPASASAAGPDQGAAGDGALRDRIAQVLARRGVPGAGVALVSPEGGARAFGVGLADAASGRPVEAGTLFRLASISKSVTALALVRLAEEGKLSLEARLRQVAPEVSFENPWEESHPLRVQDLLEQTAGFEFVRYAEEWEWAPSPRPLLEVLQQSPAARRCRWPPGTMASYSNEGYLVAGYLVERVAGVPFDAAVRQLVLAPLGMEDAAFQLDPERAARLATGTQRGRAVAYREDGIRPAAGLLASPRDLARWLAFWAGGGASGEGPVSAPGLRRMAEAHGLGGAAPPLAYGLGNVGVEWRGRETRGHHGDTDGFTSSFAVLPGGGVGWAVLLDAESPEALAEVEAEVAAALLPGPPPPSEDGPAPDSAALAALAGWYRELSTPREVWAPLGAIGGVQVEVRGGQLARRELSPGGLRGLFRPGPWEALSPRGGGRFAPEGKLMAGLRFEERGGEQLLREPLRTWRREGAGRAALARWALQAAALLLASALLLGPAALLWALARGGPPPWPQLLGAASALVAGAGVLLLTHGAGHLWRPSVVSEAVWALSLLFPALALAALAASARALQRQPVTAGRLHALLVAVACTGLAAWAWQSRWIGLQTWKR